MEGERESPPSGERSADLVRGKNERSDHLTRRTRAGFEGVSNGETQMDVPVVPPATHHSSVLFFFFFWLLSHLISL